MSERSSIAVAARLDLGRLRLHQMDGLPGHDGRDRMLIYELRVTVPTQQHTKVVEPAHDSLELHTVDQKDCEWGLVLSHVVQERVLKVLDSVCTHGLLSPFFRSALGYSGRLFERSGWVLYYGCYFALHYR